MQERERKSYTSGMQKGIMKILPPKRCLSAIKYRFPRKKDRMMRFYADSGNSSLWDIIRKKTARGIRLQTAADYCLRL